MNEQTKSVLIGVFFTVACILLIWMVAFLKPSIGDGKQTLYVRFSNIDRINVGTRVLFAGKPIGEVTSIEEIQNARQKPLSDLLQRLYYYQLVLKIDSKVKVYDTDEVIVQTAGLLGERFIAIIPKVPPKGTIPKCISNQPIYADSVNPIESAFIELKDLFADLQKKSDAFNNWFFANQQSFIHAADSFANAMTQVKSTLQELQDQEIIEKTKTALNHFSCIASQISDAIDRLNAHNSFDNAGAAIAHIRNTAESFDRLSYDLECGTGTLGKLIKQDDVYWRLTTILGKADTMMNDINHYGLLFNSNKSWQRQRAQRICLMNSLDTPLSFKEYFTAEIDLVNTAMARISMLIDKAKYNPQKQDILDHSQFQEEFMELMRQVENLTNDLRLYKEELIQAQ
ncbi:MAG: MlaD family protein [Chlamydiales bacterium]|jgi:phospholipid/cholesterol/gamma-HCH transport system substrate-binding protein|nr:MlaD family protein [Chlamydiales bacterium]